MPELRTYHVTVAYTETVTKQITVEVHAEDDQKATQKLWQYGYARFPFIASPCTLERKETNVSITRMENVTGSDRALNMRGLDDR